MSCYLWAKINYYLVYLTAGQIITVKCQYRQINFLIPNMMTCLSKGKRSASNQHQNIKNYTYSSQDRIGKGFSSIVYRGVNQITNQVIAIKAIDMKGVKDKVSKEMLDCQIQALSKLKHPNILRCYDVIKQISHCYIITEYCNEGDLSSALKKKRRMSQIQVIKIMQNIVEGYIEIAQNKFLHRDLKLANIFMREGVAKIADFGFAKKSYASFQRQKYNVGSPLYMSPQALKKNIYSTKNDIWSIGIMIYEMLHGQTPWECKTESQLIQKMAKVPVKFRQSLGLSQQIKDFINKCLQVDQTKRMSLNELKQWCGRNNIDEASSGSTAKRLQQKSLKQQQSNRIIKPLGDATNRYSLGVQKMRSASNVSPKLTKQLKINTDYQNQDKQNNRNFVLEQRRNISKVVINKNNTIVLIQINKFRLLYKIYQKIILICPHQKQILNALGTDILTRVHDIVDILLNPVSDNSNKKAHLIGLKELDSYLREETNSSIQKYISVVKQYQKKYISTIKMFGRTEANSNCNQMLKRLISANRPNLSLSKDEIIMFYWILQALNLGIDVKKQELDHIIDARSTLTKEEIMERITKLQ